MPSLLLDLKPPSSAHPQNTPPKNKPVSWKTTVFLLLGGSRNKIMDEMEKHTKSFSSTAAGPGKNLRLRNSAHKRNRLAVEEGDRKKVKELVNLLENLWKSVSKGATTVPQGTMQLMKAHLGEGGTQCFDEVFAPLEIAGAPDILVTQHFWYCWTEFLAHSLNEDFVKDEDCSMQDNFSHTEGALHSSLYGHLSQHNMESAEDGQKRISNIEISLKDRIKAYFFKSNRISEQFCQIRLANMEREWIKVAGSLSEPLTAYNMNQFLTFVLVDYPHVITTYNCKEFCDYFDKKLEAQGIHMYICVYVRVCICINIHLHMYIISSKIEWYSLSIDIYRCSLPRRKTLLHSVLYLSGRVRACVSPV